MSITIDLHPASGVVSPAAPTTRACLLASMLGVTIDDLRPPRAPSVTTPPESVRLRPGGLAVILGASGAGKSTLLHGLASQAASAGWTPVHVSRRRLLRQSRGVIDTLCAAASPSTRPCGDIVAQAAAVAAQAGLSDARVLTSRLGELSTGQHARLDLALALARARRVERPVLVIDEFGASIDRATARSLAASLARWARREQTPVILATNHPEVLVDVRPEPVIELSMDHQPRVVDRVRRQDACDQPIRIEAGDLRDYDTLASAHYRSAPPANPSRVLRAIDPELSQTVGVIVVAHPTLNASWRDLAWPGRYTRGPKRERAARLNRELRTIARVVVAPTHRGRGLATALTRAYLRDPDTPCTESVATMARFNPFMERAGMTAYALAPTARDARVHDALDHAGLCAWRLTQPAALAKRVDASPQRDLITRELGAWARASGATRRLEGQPLERQFEAFARRAGPGSRARVAYAHTAT